MIKPHGGILIDRVLKGGAKKKARERVRDLFKSLWGDFVKDVENIACGAFSPLEGFLGEKDYLSILYQKTLTNDIPWTIPSVLDVSRGTMSILKEGDDIALADEGRQPVAIFHLEGKFSYDKKILARNVFGTTDRAYPGVVKVLRMKEVLLGRRLSQKRKKSKLLAKRMKNRQKKTTRCS